MADGRRARSEEQKQERRQALLLAAGQLFETTPYQEIAMATVAERAGMAKGTTYLYFMSKEGLFLALLEDRLRHWFDEVDAALRGLAAPATVPEIAALLSHTLVQRPGLTRLLALLHGILEQNIDLATALRFKRWLGERLLAIGALLEGRLPFLEPGQGAQALLRCYALVIGLWQMADPAPIVRQALTEPDLALFAIDFAREFEGSTRALLHGMERS